MATFIRRGNVWQAKIRQKGRRIIARTFDTKTAAQKWARSIERELDQGTYLPSTAAERTTVADAVDRYVKEIMPKLAGGGKSSMSILARLKAELGSLSLAFLDSSHVSAYRDKVAKRYSPQTVLHDIGFLNRILGCCQKDWGIHLPRGVVTESVRLPSRPEGRDRRFNEGEEEKLLEAACCYGDGQLACIIAFAVETAMRRTELASICAEHVDWKKKYVLLPKTKTGVSRRVPLSPLAFDILFNRERKTGLIWDMRPDSISQAFERVCITAGIENLRFHDLRHEATSRLFELGLNMIEVAAITGHTSLEMLKRYTHPRADEMAKKLERKYAKLVKRGRPQKL